MFFARWVILLSLQAVFLNTTLSTVSEGSSDESRNEDRWRRVEGIVGGGRG